MNVRKIYVVLAMFGAVVNVKFASTSLGDGHVLIFMLQMMNVYMYLGVALMNLWLLRRRKATVTFHRKR